jgi:hypothetical protein
LKFTPLCTELLVGVGAIDTDAKHDYIPLLVLRLVALKVVRLDRAAAGEVFGIEVQDDPLTAILLQADRLAFLRGEHEFWRQAAHRRCGSGKQRQRRASERQNKQRGYQYSMRHEDLSRHAGSISGSFIN